MDKIAVCLCEWWEKNRFNYYMSSSKLCVCVCIIVKSHNCNTINSSIVHAACSIHRDRTMLNEKKKQNKLHKHNPIEWSKKRSQFKNHCYDSRTCNPTINRNSIIGVFVDCLHTYVYMCKCNRCFLSVKIKQNLYKMPLFHWEMVIPMCGNVLIGANVSYIKFATANEHIQCLKSNFDSYWTQTKRPDTTQHRIAIKEKHTHTHT